MNYSRQKVPNQKGPDDLPDYIEQDPAAAMADLF